MKRLATLTLSFAALALCAMPLAAQDHTFHAAGVAPLHVAGGAPVHAAGVFVPQTFRPSGRVAFGPSSVPPRHDRHHGFPRYGTPYVYGYVYGVPYFLPYGNEYEQPDDGGPYEKAPAAEPQESRTGPTIFEHNGQLSEAPSRYAEREEPPQRSEAETNTPLAPTLLVFRDGHQQEIENYAIAGSKLIVLGERPQKIALVDIDVDATVKANDDRGVDFKLPNQS